MNISNCSTYEELFCSVGVTFLNTTRCRVFIQGCNFETWATTTECHFTLHVLTSKKGLSPTPPIGVLHLVCGKFFNSVLLLKNVVHRLARATYCLPCINIHSSPAGRLGHDPMVPNMEKGLAGLMSTFFLGTMGSLSVHEMSGTRARKGQWTCAVTTRNR